MVTKESENYEKEIREVAYYLFERRGRIHGHDVEDWLKSERIVKRRHASVVRMIIDESGAKGYSDKRESEPGELGVMVGYLVPESYAAEVKVELDRIRNAYISHGKIHITDLTPKEQQALRDKIIRYFKAKQIPWVYESTYVEGFYKNAESVAAICTRAKAERRSPIKLSSHEKKDLLHSELFLGTFGKSVAFCLDFIGAFCKIDIVTDRIDDKIKRVFREEADRLLTVGERKIEKVKGYDPETKTVVQGAIIMEVTGGKDMLGDFSGISYAIRSEDSALTLAADVLANSVYYHLKQSQAYSLGRPLNTRAAIQGHPLESLVYGVFDDQVYVPDAVYLHPEWEAKLPQL